MSNVQISVVYSGRGLPGRVRGLVRLGPARSERARSAGATRGGSPSDRRYGGRRGPGRRAPFQTRMRHAGSTTEPMVSRPRHEASCPGSRRRLSASSPSPMCVRGRSDSPGRRWVRSSDAGTAEVPGAPHLRGLSSVGRHRSPGGPGGRHVTTDYWGRIRRSRSETVRTSGPRADLDGSPSTGQLAVVVIPNAGNVLAISSPRPPVPPGATMPLSPEVHRPIRQSAIRMPAHDESVTGFVVSKPEVRAAEGKSRCVCLCLPERCDAGPCVARWLESSEDDLVERIIACRHSASSTSSRDTLRPSSQGARWTEGNSSIRWTRRPSSLVHRAAAVPIPAPALPPILSLQS